MKFIPSNLCVWIVHYLDILLLTFSLNTYDLLGFNTKMANASDELPVEFFPLWLSRYVQSIVGKGVKPAIDLIVRGESSIWSWNTGIQRILDPRFLSLFSVPELEKMVFGTPIEWTTDSLLQSVLFTQGYSKKDPYIHDFVSILVSLTQELKERFMMFVTGERRVSVCVDRLNEM